MTKPATGSASTIEVQGASMLLIPPTMLICPQLAAMLSTRLSTLLLRVAESSVGGGIDAWGGHCGCTGVKRTGIVIVNIFTAFVGYDIGTKVWLPLALLSCWR